MVTYRVCLFMFNSILNIKLNVDHTSHFSTLIRTTISMFLEVNTLCMDVKLDFAIPIRLLISFSHLASEEIKLPK